MTTLSTTTMAARYFSSWMNLDFDAFRALLADEVTFAGSMATARGVDDCVQGVRKLRDIITGLPISRVFVDGDDAITWYEMHTTAAPPIPVANWIHVTDGLITEIRAVFDPRPLLG
jgi:ketosteroid isomerase-like protein